MATTGRPSKIHSEAAAAIITNLSIGASRTDSVLAAKVNYQTFLNWLERGEEAKIRRENGAKLTKDETVFLEFLENVEAAETQCAIDMQIIVYNSAQRNAADARWWLERRRSKEFRPPPETVEQDTRISTSPDLMALLQKAYGNPDSE